VEDTHWVQCRKLQVWLIRLPFHLEAKDGAIGIILLPCHFFDDAATELIAPFKTDSFEVSDEKLATDSVRLEGER